MGLLRKSGWVGRVATLGNSANLHKSMMAAADGGGILTFLLVNLQSRAKHQRRIRGYDVQFRRHLPHLLLLPLPLHLGLCLLA